MSWKLIESGSDLDRLAANSARKPQLIYKHSTRCGLCSTAKFQIDKEMDVMSNHFDLHYLDLLAHRDLSNEIATRFDVPHASPQVIVLYDGMVVFDLSHALVTPRFILDYTARELGVK